MKYISLNTFKFPCTFGIVWHIGFVYSKQFSSSVMETKRETILFCLEVNSPRYSEMEESIRLRKNHYPSVR